MKSIIFISPILVLLFCISCNKEEEIDCHPAVGEMRALVNDSLELDFRFVYYFRDTMNTAIDIQSYFINSGCEYEVSLDLNNIKKTKSKQSLVKIIFGDTNHPSRKVPNSIFWT